MDGIQTIKGCDFNFKHCAYSDIDSSVWNTKQFSEHHNEGYGPVYDHTSLGSKYGQCEFYLTFLISLKLLKDNM